MRLSTLAGLLGAMGTVVAILAAYVTAATDSFALALWVHAGLFYGLATYAAMSVPARVETFVGRLCRGCGALPTGAMRFCISCGEDRPGKRPRAA